MTDTWGPDGPPDDTYSRVTRDLGAVTAEFAAYLKELPERLTARYDCVRRGVTATERARMGEEVVDSAWAVQPRGAQRATLLVGVWNVEGGVGASVAMGRVIDEPVPSCFCDACDEDSDSLIDQVESLVMVAVGGFHEFRRPYAAKLRERLFDGPWMEIGYESDGASTSRAGHDVRGEPFSLDWLPWSVR